MIAMHLNSEISQLSLSDIRRKPSVGEDHIPKRLRPAFVCSPSFEATHYPPIYIDQF